MSKSIYNKIIRSQPVNSSVNDLTNVQTNNLQARDVFIYQNGNWTNSRVDYSELTNAPNPTTLDSLTDVTISTTITNQILKYNGSIWENAFLLDNTYSYDLTCASGNTIVAQKNKIYICNLGILNITIQPSQGDCIKIVNLAGSQLNIQFIGTTAIINNTTYSNQSFTTTEANFLELNYHNATTWAITKLTNRLYNPTSQRYITLCTPNLEDLKNLAISSPQNNQLLRYNGVSWVNSNEASYLRAFTNGVLVQNQTVTMTNNTFYRGVNATVTVLPGSSTYLGATMSLWVYNGTCTLNFAGNAFFSYLDIPWSAGSFTSSDNGAQITISCILISGAIAHYSFDSIVGEWTFSEPGYKKLTSAWTGIENLKNVSVTTPASGDILSYNGSDWVNINPSRCLPTAEFFMQGNGSTATLTLTTVNVWYQFADTTTLVTNPAGSLVFSMSSAGRIQYSGASNKFFHTAVSISSATNDAGDNYQIALFKGGTLIPGSVFSVDFANNNQATSTAFHKVLELLVSDIIDIRIRNITASNKIITFNNVNYVLMACCN